MLRALALLAALALAGCASGETDVPPAPEAAPDASGAPATDPGAASGDHGSAPLAGAVTYACADGGTFTVTPIGDGATAEVALPGETLTLERTESSMGVRYGEGDVEVWIADEGAFVARDGEMTLADCREATDA